MEPASMPPSSGSGKPWSYSDLRIRVLLVLGSSAWFYALLYALFQRELTLGEGAARLFLLVGRFLVVMVGFTLAGGTDREPVMRASGLVAGALILATS